MFEIKGDSLAELDLLLGQAQRELIGEYIKTKWISDASKASQIMNPLFRDGKLAAYAEIYSDLSSNPNPKKVTY